MLEIYVIGYVHWVYPVLNVHAGMLDQLIDCCNYNIYNNINTILCVITNYKHAK